MSDVIMGALTFTEVRFVALLLIASWLVSCAVIRTIDWLIARRRRQSCHWCGNDIERGDYHHHRTNGITTRVHQDCAEEHGDAA